MYIGKAKIANADIQGCRVNGVQEFFTYFSNFSVSLFKKVSSTYSVTDSCYCY